MTDERRRPMYASLQPREHKRLKAIRDEAWNRLDPPEGYDKVEPHVTIHPGFTCDRSGAIEVTRILAYAIGEPLGVEGLSFWPSAEDPAVVKLDIDADLAKFQRAIERAVEAKGGTVDTEPVPLHLTLFKASGADEGEPGSLRAGKKRKESIAGDYGGWEATVNGYCIEERG